MTRVGQFVLPLARNEMDGKKRRQNGLFDWRRDLLNELKRGAKANTIHNDREVAEGSKDYTVWQPTSFLYHTTK